MNEIYFEVPITTNEVLTSIVSGELYSFRIVFFESSYSNLRMVTIRADYKDDGSIETESLSSVTDSYHDNEFDFDYEVNENLKLNIHIFMDDTYRIIHMKY